MCVTCVTHVTQGQVDAAVKAKTTAEASVSAMKSQLKGFDTHMDKLMEVSYRQTCVGELTCTSTTY